MAKASVSQRADDAHEMAVEAIAITQAQGFILGALLAVMRDTGALRREVIGNIFIGAAAVIDHTPAPDEATRQTLAASRDHVSQMAKSFGTDVPPPGQTGIPFKN